MHSSRKFKTKRIAARKALNSRAEWTIEVTVETAGGIEGTACVPLGKSKSPYETQRLQIDPALTFINSQLSARLASQNICEQQLIDNVLLDSEDSLSTNVLFAVSAAVARAAAQALRRPLFIHLAELAGDTSSMSLPLPYVTLFMGGLHKFPHLHLPDRASNLQVVQVVAVGESFVSTIKDIAEIYVSIGEYLMEKNLYRGIGQDGGYAFFGTNEQMLDIACGFLDKHRSRFREVGLALDVAGLYLKTGDAYEVNDNRLTPHKMARYIEQLVRSYPIFSIEDPFDHHDLDCWSYLTKAIGHDTQVVGDDIFGGDKRRIEATSADQVANTVLLKPDYVGSVSQIVDLVAAAKRRGLSLVVSHRSGETIDSFIADLAVAVQPTGAFFTGIRAGAPARGERIAKWNRLIAIEDVFGLSLPSSFRTSGHSVSRLSRLGAL